jgi:hypothetical protein
MSVFVLPKDIDLAEFETPFETAQALIVFVFDRENDCLAYRLLRLRILDYAYEKHLEGTDWLAIYLELIQYPELPHLSLAEYGLKAVFRAGVALLNKDHKDIE